MSVNPKKQQAFFICICCLLFFSYPLMSIANKKLLIGQVPVLYYYIFFGWIFFIALIWLNSRTKNHKGDYE